MSKHVCFITMAFFLAFVNAFSAVPWDGSVATSFGGGTGTQDDPYQIANASQLAYMTTFMKQGNTSGSGNVTIGKYFVLTDDIIINSDTINYPHKWSSIGFESDSVYSFMGSFDGQGHKIIGFTSWSIDDDAKEPFPTLCNCGVFAVFNQAKIQNTALISVHAKSFGLVESSSFSTFENIKVFFT